MNVSSRRCPVSDDLDMIGVARQYVQLELPAFALACLMLMPHSEKRRQHIEVSWKLFLWGCQRKGRPRIACPLQKVAFSLHQTYKARVHQCGQGRRFAWRVSGTKDERETEADLRGALRGASTLFVISGEQLIFP